MFTSITLRPRVFSLPRILCVTLLLLVSLTIASAQGVGAGRDITSTGGNNVISGHIYFPDNQPGDIRIKVSLESTSAGTLTTQTNAEGDFRFSGINTGYYTVVIDAGEKYEVVRERVEFDRSANGGYAAQSVRLPIYLRPIGSGSAKPGVVDAALAGVPKPAVELYQKGLEAAQKGDSKKAAELLSKAIEIHPQFALALNELGVQYLKMGQPDKAVEALQSATKIMPDEFSPRLNYGIALMNQRKFTEAEEQLRLALKKNEKAPTAHMYLGITLLSLSKDEKTKQFNAAAYEEAQKELEAAVSSGKDEVSVAHRYLGGIYWGNKEYKRAADEFETYLKLTPKASDAEKLRAAIKDLRSKG
ncbi:MAG: anaphase-promoting complex subunit 3 [Acidobacteriota bacterium]|jgi:Tfp pilus assembly protein PilF|nr:anaphase-promoting complex subunit 3 [Acidobacteriota bacterium]